MATMDAIAATCESVLQLLKRNYRPTRQGDPPILEFRVLQARDFSPPPMDEGVSLFLYRTAISSTQRTLPAPRPKDNGRCRRPQLPLDLHFIITPWAKSAAMEQRILGWAMRTIEDYPSLRAGLLNTDEHVIFDDDETLEIVPGDLTNEEMFRIWDVLPCDFILSVPYIVRLVRINTDLEIDETVVRTRDLGFGVLRD